MSCAPPLVGSAERSPRTGYRDILDPLLQGLRTGRAAEQALATESALRVLSARQVGALPPQAGLVAVPDVLSDGSVVTAATVHGVDALMRVVWLPGRHSVTWVAGRHRGRFQVCVDTDATAAPEGQLPNVVVRSIEGRRLAAGLRRLSTLGGRAWVEAYQLSLRLLYGIAAERAGMLEPSASVEDLVSAMLTSGGRSHGCDLISWLLELAATGRRPPVAWATALKRNGRLLRRVAELNGVSEEAMAARLSLSSIDGRRGPANHPVMAPLRLNNGQLRHSAATDTSPPSFYRRADALRGPMSDLGGDFATILPDTEDDADVALGADRAIVWADRWALATGSADSAVLAAGWQRTLPGVPCPARPVWEAVASRRRRDTPRQLRELWQAAFFAAAQPRIDDPVELAAKWAATAGRPLWADHNDPLAVWEHALYARGRRDVPAVSPLHRHRLLCGHDGLLMVLEAVVDGYATAVADRLRRGARSAARRGDTAVAAGLRGWAELITPRAVTAQLPVDATDLCAALRAAVRAIVATRPLHPEVVAAARHVWGDGFPFPPSDTPVPALRHLP